MTERDELFVQSIVDAAARSHPNEALADDLHVVGWLLRGWTMAAARHQVSQARAAKRETSRKPSIYSLLNQEAQLWWKHKELRAQGQAAEARRLERQSIRHDVQLLRECKANGGFVLVGPHGWTMTVSPRNQLVSKGGAASDLKLQAAIQYGLPVLDVTKLPYTDREQLSNKIGTMICDSDNPSTKIWPVRRWRDCLPIFRSFGATLINC